MHKFLKGYYIPAIEKLAFQFSRVQIIGKNECRETRKDETKSRHPHGDIIAIKYYAENIAIQHLYKFNNNIGEVTVNYQWKLLHWTISRIIAF